MPRAAGMGQLAARRAPAAALVSRTEGGASRYLGFQLAGAKRCSAAGRLATGGAVRSHPGDRGVVLSSLHRCSDRDNHGIYKSDARLATN